MPLFGLKPAGLLQTIWENIGAAVAVIDLQGNFVFANQTALDMFALGRIDGLMRFTDWRHNYQVEDSLGREIRVDDSAIMRVLRGERAASQEVRVKFPDGSTKWLFVWAYQFSAMGLRGALALVLDQTTEVELRRAAAQLQRMETLGVLAAGLTHDFNNILDTISLNVALAKQEKNPAKDRRARLEQIESAARRAAELVTRLMQFSKTQAMHMRAVHINQVARDVLRLLQPLFRDNILLKVDLSDDIPPILADPSQLEQVLVNLVVNALDAMPEGGELEVSTGVEDSAAGRTSDSGLQSVTISVADTGIGIPEELHSSIFEPFFTTKPEGQGTGLGLSSAYGIVQQHKGNIRLQSAAGAGATFVVSFPAQQSLSSAETPVAFTGATVTR
jgi:two-component system cell cycle sensor histidine kinase/response regulator CckA